MSIRDTKWHILTLAAILGCPSGSAQAIDSASIEFGTGDKTKMVRLGAQWQWESQWWKSNGTHIGGYWDATLAQWRNNRHQNILGNTQNISVLGITPVFRLQSDNQKGFYAEGGIGVHLLSELYDNGGRKLSTRFQFGDHIGFGYVFGNRLDLGLKIQHFSNGSIKKPNSGVDFAVVRIRYQF